MGCGGSKVDDLPLVIRCRERRELIRDAVDHRYALAAAHLAYFRSLKDIGDTLRRFVDEELLIASPSASPVLTLPSDEGKSSKGHINIKSSSSSPSIGHSPSISHFHSSDHDVDLEDSHLHLSSGSNSELDSSSGHFHIHDSPEVVGTSFSSPPPQAPWAPYAVAPFPQTGWGGGPYGYGYGVDPNAYPNVYYMKKSAPAIRSVIYEEPKGVSVEGSWSDSPYGYPNSYPSNPYENAGYFGFPMSSQPQQPYDNKQPSPPVRTPPPPSPKVSTWDFFNPFDSYDNNYHGYPGYYSQNKHGYGSIASSPDSNEVREREGIPDLEDETENETFDRDVGKGKGVSEGTKGGLGTSNSKTVSSQNSESSSRSGPSHSREGSRRFTRAVPSQDPSTRPVPSQDREGSSRSTRAVPSQDRGGSNRSTRTVPSQDREGSSPSTRAVPSQDSEGASRAVPMQYSEAKQSATPHEEKSSNSDTISPKSPDDGPLRKKEVSFEVDDVSVRGVESSKFSGVESSKFSGLATLSTHGTRDLQEVVMEIRDEFEVASSHGREVALMLEVDKLPYQSSFTILKVLLTRIHYLIAPSSQRPQTSSKRSVRLAFSSTKLAKPYYENSGKETNTKSSNLSCTLEKLYLWEKKLYKEVKDEERLRIIYEKECKRLKVLDAKGAESGKIDATRTSIRKLLTKIDVCIKAVDAISSKIHKLRDEELQPQVNELIHGLIRMWKSMLKCHQKQFQAIMESKARRLRAKTGFQRDSSLRTTLELEVELLAWCSHFKEWINSQKSFVESLNGWLLRCLLYEPEETPDGTMPFSPAHIGAPPIFVICNDWVQAVETISEMGVANAMHRFASSLRELCETQDEEHRQMLKAEYISKDFEKRLRTQKAARMVGGDSGKTAGPGSLVPSESGVLSVDGDHEKVDLDSMRKRMDEERERHKEAVKLVHKAASSSLQAGLVPIFEALGNLSSEALEAYEHVRTQNVKTSVGPDRK